MITENNNQKWINIIKEELGVENQGKLNWMAQYARNHEIYEGLQSSGIAPEVGRIDGNIYATPLNTLGIGNPGFPAGVGYNAMSGTGIGDTGADFHAHNYKVGSGDIPMSTLTMSLEVAAMTIGLELVPVIPSNGPWAMLQYMDFPYAGGKLGRFNETWRDGKGMGTENKPIYIKVSANLNELKQVYAAFKENNVKMGDTIEFEGADPLDSPVPAANLQLESNAGYKLHGIYIGRSRIDNGIIVKVGGYDADGKVIENPVHDGDENPASIAEVFAGNVTINGVTLSLPHADVVAAAADHVQEFSNFFGKHERDDEGNVVVKPSDDPMTRAQNETGVGNTIGARFFTKMVQMGAYEVTGSVTRQQLQDMPLYGIDVVGKVLEAMQNELSQAINNRILDRLFRLGVTNAITQKEYQGVDLNLYFGSATDPDTKNAATFTAASKFVGIRNEQIVDAADTATYYEWGEIKNATKNTAAENVYTHQRRIMSRILAGANLIANVSRFGRGNWVVTNTQILSALQDCAGFVVAPMVNTLTQDGSQSIYFAGSVAGLNIYVDPYMTWDDTRVLIGRKSDGTTPGVVFMPYILCDTVQTIVEGTMAPKLLVNSRFAIVDAGFHPEQSYFCFMVDAQDGFIL